MRIGSLVPFGHSCFTHWMIIETKLFFAPTMLVSNVNRLVTVTAAGNVV